MTDQTAITTVIHCFNRHWTDPDEYVYIGRPSPWGNPFRIGPDGDRAEVIRRYAAWVHEPAQRDMRDRVRSDLRGKVLGCYCSPEHCHGDVLAEICNRRPDEFMDVPEPF